MILTSASGFVIFLLSITVVQGWNGWGVTYTSTNIRAVRGSSVTINCTYTYPPSINTQNTMVTKTLWFRKDNNNRVLDLKEESDSSGRVQYVCVENRCSVRISDLRQSDSAEYMFRFITNQPGGSYSGSPGVYLTVTDFPPDPPRLPSVSVSPSGQIVQGSSVTLTCTRDANPPVTKYTWYKEDEDSPKASGPDFTISDIRSEDSGNYYCEAQNSRGRQNSTSHLITVSDPSRLPSVSVIPSGQIVEGTSVALICSNDANQAAHYVWYKEGEDEPKASGQIFIINNIRPEHSGYYYCEAQNRGRQNSSSHLITVSIETNIIVNIIKLSLLVLLISVLIFTTLCFRKKKTQHHYPEMTPLEPVELDPYPIYENVSTTKRKT